MRDDDRKEMTYYEQPVIGTVDIEGISQSIASVDTYNVISDLDISLADKRLSKKDKTSITRSLADIQQLALDLSRIALTQEADRDVQIERVSLAIKNREYNVIALLRRDYRVSVTSLPRLKLLDVASLISVLFASVNHANVNERALSPRENFF